MGVAIRGEVAFDPDTAAIVGAAIVGAAIAVVVFAVVATVCAVRGRAAIFCPVRVSNGVSLLWLSLLEPLLS